MSEGLFSEFATAFVGTMIHMKEDVIGPSQLIPNWRINGPSGSIRNDPNVSWRFKGLVEQGGGWVGSEFCWDCRGKEGCKYNEQLGPLAYFE